VIVFNYHMLFVWTPRTDISYGTVINPEKSQQAQEDKASESHLTDEKFLIQLPFVRLLYAGHAMVIVFFVISGYVLAHKPMKLVQLGKYEEVQRVLASSVFRRGIRLFGPTVIGTFITMLMTNAGYFESGKAVRTDSDTYQGNKEEHPVQFAIFYDQCRDWLSTLAMLVRNVWEWNICYNNYDPHLWTIPLEFRSSMVLFTTLLGLSRLRSAARLLLMSALLYSCLFHWARWEVFLFLAGMMFAELDIISGIFVEQSPLDEKAPRRSNPFIGSVWAGIMLLGLFLSSCPTLHAQKAPGYIYLATFMPEDYGWQIARPIQALGGCLVVWSFMHLPRVQIIFTTSVAQYLGQISYAFYIVHGPILHSFGYNLILTCWEFTGKETTKGFASGLALAVLVIFPVAIWMADVFWRAVDGPCVELAKWIEKRTSILRDDR
jgi:peptidoglycan/LPS O-acetylase OafA/YrhL